MAWYGVRRGNSGGRLLGLAAERGRTDTRPFASVAPCGTRRQRRRYGFVACPILHARLARSAPFCPVFFLLSCAACQGRLCGGLPAARERSHASARPRADAGAGYVDDPPQPPHTSTPPNSTRPPYRLSSASHCTTHRSTTPRSNHPLQLRLRTRATLSTYTVRWAPPALSPAPPPTPTSRSSTDASTSTAAAPGPLHRMTSGGARARRRRLAKRLCRVESGVVQRDWCTARGRGIVARV